MTNLKEFRLMDGRTISCTSAAEARMLWVEMSDEGFYRSAAATLRDGDVVLDIGANIGLSAIMFADTRPGVRVIAAEPAPVTFECLARNLGTHVPGSVPLRVAAGRDRGRAQFTWYPRASANSGLYADQRTDDKATEIFLRNSGLDDDAIGVLTNGLHVGEEIEVEVTTVSDIIESHCPDAEIGVLKVDVERAEMDVLEGISDTHWPRIHTVVAEVHDLDGRLNEICDLLGAKGFRVHARQDRVLSGTELNEVFATRDRS
ncbi:FkbM family methyltransferase [Nocardia sp. NPDC003693]